MRLLLLLFCPILGFCQTRIERKPIQLFAEVGGFYGSSKQTPFWLRSNQYGTVPTDLPYASVRTGLRWDSRFYPIDDNTPIKKRDFFGFGYGVELVGNTGAGSKTTLIIPELYGKLRAGAFELVAGRRREVVGLVDSTLSSGSFSWSGNALPLPKIQIGLSQYTPIPLTAGILSVRGFFAHGWFEQKNFVSRAFLHQKALYARIGKAKWPVKLYAGFNHQAEWGGTTSELSDGLIKEGRFPSNFQAYSYMVTGSSLGYNPGVDTTYYSRFDRENRIGNHLGSIDVGLEFSTKKMSILLYRQSVYEDGSLFYRTNLEDGLNGIRFRSLKPATSGFRITGAVVELLYTKSQGGSVFEAADKLRGRDNYFNHSQYRSGWSYFGQGIGTPFITPMTTARPDLPQYGFFSNNRVRAFHTGLQGGFGRNCTFQMKLSYSENFGTYDVPFPNTVEQFSSLLQVGVPLNQSGLLVTVSAASDQGGLFPRSNGVYAGIRKTWDYYQYRSKRM
ncbi:capsule assembly Wzi family protein [Larkinella sp. GY13]|uniref:capsule assembly Wzi family protein n=1 Tax=Larkinella sp. GY13 TaxID=3453720 RepID=UPI003EEF3766